VGELITIPLTSERKAVGVLASLRRLEAEYQVGQQAERRPPGLGGAHTRTQIGAILRQGFAGLGQALVGGVLGLTLAAICIPVLRALPWASDIFGRAEGALCGLAAGIAAGLALGLVVHLAGRWRANQATADEAMVASATVDGDVSWLVSYVSCQRDETGIGQLRVSVLRLCLPEAAEGRLRTLLERAAATSAT
jgi:hypothetical protein